MTRNHSFTFDPVMAGRFLSVLANPWRIQILLLLVEREWNVTALGNELSLTNAVVSQHLVEMRAMSLVTKRRDKQLIYYRCDSRAVSSMLTTLGMMTTAGLLDD